MMKSRPVVAVALVFALATAPVAAHAAAPDRPKTNAITGPLVTLESLVVNDIVALNGQLVAKATATLDVAGTTVTRAVQFPLTLGGTAGMGGSCDILNLSLGPIHLNLLGLIVNLDDCNGGPVTIDITGTTGDGDLLGNLVCAVAGLLDSGTTLGDILGGLTSIDAGQLTAALTDLLNDFFSQALDPTNAAPMVMAAQANGACPILDLMIPEGIIVDLLGLVVETSPICLNISAQSGPGNLLGNLLCSLTDLLNNRGNNLQAQRVLLRNIANLLSRLGL